MRVPVRQILAGFEIMGGHLVVVMVVLASIIKMGGSEDTRGRQVVACSLAGRLLGWHLTRIVVVDGGGF